MTVNCRYYLADGVADVSCASFCGVVIASEYLLSVAYTIGLASVTVKIPL